MRAVSTRSDLFTGSAAGVGRLVALVAVLLGFIAMHGLAATDGDGTHHSPLSISAAPYGHSGWGVTPASDEAVDQGAGGSPGVDGIPAATGQPSGSADGHGFHAAIAGCLIALCGLVILALTAPGRATLTERVREMAALRQQPGSVRPGHPPPRRFPRISLCVLRV